MRPSSARTTTRVSSHPQVICTWKVRSPRRRTSGVVVPRRARTASQSTPARTISATSCASGEKVLASSRTSCRKAQTASTVRPTGTAVTKDAFEAFLRDVPERVIVAADEAYFEYMDDPARVDSLHYQDSGKIVVTLRTFSKCYGLAGLRIGYGVAHPLLVDYLNRVRQPFNTNVLAQVGALAALDDDAHLRASVENNRRGRTALYEGLDALGVGYTRTQANFLLVHLPRKDGQAVHDRLLRLGVIVRPMGSYDLPGTIRVTIGTPEENARFLAALREVLR